MFKITNWLRCWHSRLIRALFTGYAHLMQIVLQQTLRCYRRHSFVIHAETHVTLTQWHNDRSINQCKKINLMQFPALWDQISRLRAGTMRLPMILIIAVLMYGVLSSIYSIIGLCVYVVGLLVWSAFQPDVLAWAKAKFKLWFFSKRWQPLNSMEVPNSRDFHKAVPIFWGPKPSVANVEKVRNQCSSSAACKLLASPPHLIIAVLVNTVLLELAMLCATSNTNNDREDAATPISNGEIVDQSPIEHGDSFDQRCSPDIRTQLEPVPEISGDIPVDSKPKIARKLSVGSCDYDHRSLIIN